jgi:hypothetical protein
MYFQPQPLPHSLLHRFIYLTKVKLVRYPSRKPGRPNQDLLYRLERILNEFFSFYARFQLVIAIQCNIFFIEGADVRLGVQVDKLRQAGQDSETIALDEERLSPADVARYELPDALATMQSGPTRVADAPRQSPSTAVRHVASVPTGLTTRLHKQTAYLRGRRAALEEPLEDTRVHTERADVPAEESVRRTQS